MTPDRALAFAGRLGVKPLDVDAAHDAMLSVPDRVAAILKRV